MGSEMCIRDREKEAVEKRMYTVTFRAGNVASFDIDKITVSDGMEVTKNYIKVKVYDDKK